ncbi:MAG: hypothetical protein EZS28_002102 [Streblomastix strix]|uniref:Uncharacterized protein n=1 Tax=Streblomastix strix TaxID=222440 RepID=A0A5J4X503_9EUKA|nr:MAG: hypothetical protein EZS28_002102 [Streblomastix strix]
MIKYSTKCNITRCDTLTLFLVHKSLRELRLITAYSRAQNADPQNAVASFSNQNWQNGSHAVEKPIQNYRSSHDSIPPAVLPQYPYDAYDIFVVQSAVGSSLPLKLVRATNLPAVLHSLNVLFNYIANVFAGIVIVQFTQQVYTTEHADLPPAPNNTLVYLTPLDITNFGSKILGGVKKTAQWVVPALHKVLSTISGPVDMIHPAIGSALGA